MRGLHSAETAAEGVLTRRAIVSERTVFRAFKLCLDKSPSPEKGGASLLPNKQKEKDLRRKEYANVGYV